MFSGQLVIGQVSITQGELLQDQEPAVISIPESHFPEPHGDLCLRLNDRSSRCTDCIRAVLTRNWAVTRICAFDRQGQLHRKGLLDGYNYKTVGFDKHLLAFSESRRRRIRRDRKPV